MIPRNTLKSEVASGHAAVRYLLFLPNDGIGRIRVMFAGVYCCRDSSSTSNTQMGLNACR